MMSFFCSGTSICQVFLTCCAFASETAVLIVTHRSVSGRPMSIGVCCLASGKQSNPSGFLAAFRFWQTAHCRRVHLSAMFHTETRDRTKTKQTIWHFCLASDLCYEKPTVSPMPFQHKNNCQAVIFHLILPDFLLFVKVHPRKTLGQTSPSFFHDSRQIFLKRKTQRQTGCLCVLSFLAHEAFYYPLGYVISACAAAKRAIGTLNGEQDT